MEQNGLETPKYFPYECSKIILLECSQNVHKYANEKYDCNRAIMASHIIFNVSLVNWDLYKRLDKQRNDPLTARTIITNITYSPDIFDCNVAEFLSFPGAKKCLILSKQLYDKDNTPNTIETLFQQGAMLDYSDRETCQYPLEYWCNIKHNNSQTNKAIVQKLLQLGASPIKCDLLHYGIKTENIDLVKMVLTYNPRMSCKVWEAALSNKTTRKYIDLLIGHSTCDELTDGLISCIQANYNPIYSHYRQLIMKNFIDKGANRHKALSHLIAALNYENNSLFYQTIFVENFNFLCDQKAFDETSLNKMRCLQKTFASLADTLRNQKEYNVINLQKAEYLHQTFCELANKLEKNQREIKTE